MYKHYEGLSSVNLAATNKLRNLLLGVLNKGWSTPTHTKSSSGVYDEIVTDLYVAYKSTMAKATNWENTAQPAWDLAMEKATAYNNSSTYAEGKLFLDQFAGLKAAWPTNLTDGAAKVGTAGSAAKAWADHQALAISA